MAEWLDTIAIPDDGMATIYTDTIRGTRGKTLCRYCKKEIPAGSKCLFRIDAGVNAREWTWHDECYDRVEHKGMLEIS
jgi:hypothetical protein